MTSKKHNSIVNVVTTHQVIQNRSVSLFQQVLPSQGCHSIMLANDLLLSFIGNSVTLLSTVSAVLQTLHIMCKNLSHSIILQNGQQVTVPLFSYHMDLYSQAVWCGTLSNQEVMCGNTVNTCISLPCAMVHCTWHTATARSSTWSVGGCTERYCPSCSGVSVIPHLPNWEHGHWEISLMQKY